MLAVEMKEIQRRFVNGSGAGTGQINNYIYWRCVVCLQFVHNLEVTVGGFDGVLFHGDHRQLNLMLKHLYILNKINNLYQFMLNTKTFGFDAARQWHNLKKKNIYNL